MKKSDLRKIFLEKRLAMPQEEFDAASRAVADRFFSETDLANVRTLHCYIPMAKFREIDTSLIIDRIHDEHPQIRTAAPRLDASRLFLEHVLFTAGSELVRNTWGILEPAAGERVAAKEIDLVIVPLLCHDRDRFRVGYGKGFYDRFLSECRPDCLTVGLGLFPPVDRITDLHDGDVPLDAVVTPGQTYH